MGGRLYLWLVCHDACPCQWPRLLGRRKVNRLGWTYKFCDWLERRYFWLDDSVAIADEIELRVEDAP